MNGADSLGLSPEQEATRRRLRDALIVARAGPNRYAQIAAAGALLDWQMEVGLLTVEAFRTMLLERHHFTLLDNAVRVLVEHDRELAEAHEDVALDKMFNGDLAEAGWGALVAHAFLDAREDLLNERRLTPHVRASLEQYARGILALVEEAAE